MKIVTVTLGSGPDDRPEREGWVIVSYSAKEGGRTSSGVQIKRPRWTEVGPGGAVERVGPFPTWREVATLIDQNMQGRSWPEFIRHKSEGNVVKLSCPDTLDAAVFYAEFNPHADQNGPHEPAPAFVKIAGDAF